MATFKKSGKKAMPAISTGSLPDIVFMILLFFMVTTTMRQTEHMVMVSLPAASEISKLERKDLSSYIYVGTPLKKYQGKYGTDSRIQLNDSFRSVDEIRDFVASERENLSEQDRPFMTVNIKADKDTRMGIITDIKQELRRCNALKILYGANAVE